MHFGASTLARAYLLLSALSLLLCAGCSSSTDARATTVQTLCTAGLCSGHGTCDDASGTATCSCFEGFQGEVCGACRSGYHRDGADLCAKDEACAATSCGAHGTCSADTGVALCACADGYTGKDCTACYAGYHADGNAGCALDTRCASTSCSGAGTCADASGAVVCTCDAGYAGAVCDACKSGFHRGADGKCAADSACPATGACSGHGACVDTSGAALCGCDRGYRGDSCAACAPGFHLGDGGACTLDLGCTATSCSGNGTCSAPGGVLGCDCYAGYAGGFCDACASGYHRGLGWACVADTTCAQSDPCGAHGACIDAAGSTSCSCDEGWAGATCSACGPGFHDPGDGTCAIDEHCGPASCSLHGACEDATLVVACTCDAGFSGAHCETNVDDCVNASCGTGLCVDLVNDFVCLCADSTWAKTCP